MEFFVKEVYFIESEFLMKVLVFMFVLLVFVVGLMDV